MSIQIEVGLYSLMHTGMLGTIGQAQSFDPSKVALLVFNDARDVYYEVEAADGTTEEIHPEAGGQNTAVVALNPGQEHRLEHLNPSRLFCHQAGGQTWPMKMFKMLDGKEQIGTIDTVFVLDDTTYTWTNLESGEHLVTMFDTLDTLKAYKITRDTDPVAMLDGAIIKNVKLVRKGGSAQKCCPSGDPP